MNSWISLKTLEFFWKSLKFLWIYRTFRTFQRVRLFSELKYPALIGEYLIFQEFFLKCIEISKNWSEKFWIFLKTAEFLWKFIWKFVHFLSSSRKVHENRQLFWLSFTSIFLKKFFEELELILIFSHEYSKVRMENLRFSTKFSGLALYEKLSVFQ